MRTKRTMIRNQWSRTRIHSIQMAWLTHWPYDKKRVTEDTEKSFCEWVIQSEWMTKWFSSIILTVSDCSCFFLIVCCLWCFNPSLAVFFFYILVIFGHELWFDNDYLTNKITYLICIYQINSLHKSSTHYKRRVDDFLLIPVHCC